MNTYNRILPKRRLERILYMNLLGSECDEKDDHVYRSR